LPTAFAVVILGGMDDLAQPKLPALIVVTGRPGSGKTTLAKVLSTAVGCPMFSRDQFKEGLVHTTGSSNADSALRVYETFFQTIKLVLSQGITSIAEASFQHKRWAPKLEPLQAIARIRIIICEVGPQLAAERWLARQSTDPGRLRFHGETSSVPTLISEYEAPRLSVPTLIVNTIAEYQPDLAAISEFALR
jgi:predicted kinase